MTEYLVFRIYGPLASWGEIAVGEARHSSFYPSKSALTGLLGAALGVLRDDDARQRALVHEYRYAIQVLSPGTPLRDYHTVQSPPQQRGVRHRTRRQEVSNRARLGTLLSSREYRCDSLAVIAIEALPGARWPLTELAEALRSPYFTLYLGRKSCPLAAPVKPQVLSAESVLAAFQCASLSPLAALILPNCEAAEWPSRADRRLLSLQEPAYYWEDGMTSGLTAQMQVRRHDQPLSRRRWQFEPRTEWVCLNAEEA